MSFEEIVEYKKLKAKLQGEYMFVVVKNTADWRRFNELSKKYQKYLQQFRDQQRKKEVLY